MRTTNTMEKILKTSVGINVIILSLFVAFYATYLIAFVPFVALLYIALKPGHKHRQQLVYRKY